MTYTSPVKRAAQICGGLTALARIIGVTPTTVFEWANSQRPVPVKRALSIHRATGGQVTLQELRPNDFSEIWPHLTQAMPAAETLSASPVGPTC